MFSFVLVISISIFLSSFLVLLKRKQERQKLEQRLEREARPMLFTAPRYIMPFLSAVIATSVLVGMLVPENGIPWSFSALALCVGSVRFRDVTVRRLHQNRGRDVPKMPRPWAPAYRFPVVMIVVGLSVMTSLIVSENGVLWGACTSSVLFVAVVAWHSVTRP